MSFGIGVGCGKRPCDVTVTIQYLHGWLYERNEYQSRGVRCKAV